MPNLNIINGKIFTKNIPQQTSTVNNNIKSVQNFTGKKIIYIYLTRFLYIYFGLKINYLKYLVFFYKKESIINKINNFGKFFFFFILNLINAIFVVSLRLVFLSLSCCSKQRWSLAIWAILLYLPQLSPEVGREGFQECDCAVNSYIFMVSRFAEESILVFLRFVGGYLSCYLVWRSIWFFRFDRTKNKAIFQSYVWCGWGWTKNTLDKIIKFLTICFLIQKSLPKCKTSLFTN